jgi:decaprenylphospho-beta-D-ribofuranose 2-oxidase
LAVDLPGGSDLGQLLGRWDALILSAGGRVYLTKDGRLSPEMFRAMYPRWQEFEQVREATGARGRFVSDLARRLKLEG